jgi:hypothetical protein
MIKIYTYFAIGLLLQATIATAKPGTGLEIDSPQQLHVVYTIEAEQIDQNQLQAKVEASLAAAKLIQHKRDDAQLFLRVEQHQGQYLLYLDFSRQIYYTAGDNCFSKDGFVWGRYVKGISDIDELHDDVESLIDEFITDYSKANTLN